MKDRHADMLPRPPPQIISSPDHTCSCTAQLTLMFSTLAVDGNGGSEVPVPLSWSELFASVAHVPPSSM